MSAPANEPGSARMSAPVNEPGSARMSAPANELAHDDVPVILTRALSKT